MWHTLCSCLLVLFACASVQSGYINVPLPSYDYIVVGAGTAGCIVASRLSEDPSTTVLLLEAGGKTQSSVGGTDWVGRGVTRSDVPRIAYTAYEYPEDYFWPVDVVIAKGVGGGGIVNGMRWVRALEWDYQRWNISGWHFKTMLPYYIKTENNTGTLTQNSPLHGYNGPVQVSDPVYRAVEANAFVQSAIEIGIPLIKDFNGNPTSRIGTGFYQYNIRSGVRDSSANAYLAPALNRNNLHVLIEVQVVRLIFEGTAATGIEYVRNQDLSSIYSVNVSKEVVLTGGSINTPKLLLLSGIGDEPELAKFPQIKHVASVPGVGMHLQDHPKIELQWNVVNQVEPTIGSYVYWQSQYDMNKTGILAVIDSAGLFLHSGQHSFVPPNIPDIQVEVQDDGYYLVYSITPEVRNGTVKLKSANPLDPPQVNEPILPASIAASDINALVWAIGEMQNILDAPPMSSIVGQRATPPSTLTQQQLYDYVHKNVKSGIHFAGTCRMGSSAAANDVVDAQLRVFGVTGVRVADASVIPIITNGNQQANIMAIAERAAELIKNTNHV